MVEMRPEGIFQLFVREPSEHSVDRGFISLMNTTAICWRCIGIVVLSRGSHRQDNRSWTTRYLRLFEFPSASECDRGSQASYRIRRLAPSNYATFSPMKAMVRQQMMIGAACIYTPKRREAAIARIHKKQKGDVDGALPPSLVQMGQVRQEGRAKVDKRMRMRYPRTQSFEDERCGLQLPCYDS